MSRKGAPVPTCGPEERHRDSKCVHRTGVPVCRAGSSWPLLQVGIHSSRPPGCFALFAITARGVGPGCGQREASAYPGCGTSRCIHPASGFSTYRTLELGTGLADWGHHLACFPGYLSCCRFLDDNQIVTSSGDTTW